MASPRSWWRGRGALLVVAVLSATAVPAFADAGSSDAGMADAGAPVAGTADAGAPATGAADAGGPSAGAADAGSADAGSADAGGAGMRSADAGGADAGGAGTSIITPLDLARPEVSAAASPSEMRLGERFTLFVRSTHLPNVVVNLPVPPDLGPGFEIGRIHTSEARTTDGRISLEWQVEVYAWEVGEISVPPIPLTFTAGGQAAQVVTNPVPLRIVGVLPDDDSAAVARPPAAPTALSRVQWWLVALAIAVPVLVVLALVFVRWRRRDRAMAHAPAERRRSLDPASEEARRALEALRAAPTYSLELRASCEAMVGILRHYVQRRFAIPVHEATSRELLRRLEAAGAAPAWRHQLAAWLAGTDEARFSPDVPGLALVDEHWFTACTLVEAPAIEVAPPAPVEATPAQGSTRTAREST